MEYVAPLKIYCTLCGGVMIEVDVDTRPLPWRCAECQKEAQR